MLTLLSRHPGGRTLREISDALAIPIATVHRLMAVLADNEFVVRTGDSKRYSLGPAALSLAQGVRRVTAVARPPMDRLSERSQETVFLTELVGQRAVCVAMVEGTRPLRLFVRIGQELPVHAAASARALLAFAPERQVDEVLSANELTRFTDETPESVASVKSVLAEIRKRGYDVCDQELDPNVCAISAPVRAADGSVIASVTLAAPIDRMDPLSRKRDIALLKECADEISAGLGYRNPASHAETTPVQRAARTDNNRKGGIEYAL